MPDFVDDMFGCENRKCRIWYERVMSVPGCVTTVRNNTLSTGYERVMSVQSWVCDHCEK